MDWLLVLGIALANNLDNTGVGIAYGLARIRLSVPVNLWISLITFVITASSVASGSAISHLLSPQFAKFVSAAILSAIGLYMLFPFLRPRKSDVSKPRNSIHAILDDPLKADMDHSRHVDFKEGAILGMVLSINNIGGGLSAGLLHLSSTWTATLSALFSFLALWLGGALGRRLAAGRISQYATVFSGVLLIAIGLYQLR